MVDFIAETVVAIVTPYIARNAHNLARSLDLTYLKGGGGGGGGGGVTLLFLSWSFCCLSKEETNMGKK